ncbi:hypothetical protein [Pseudarthrobacter sp. B4EP4b]|uniref:hypothetical protein n=1 Tax=Pseudarthrobacter sp. B4EP4b TaxID=2590664 RepID=UPI0015EE92D7|nr:hypothetical protein [Pseudarthrobacter sp. B4EP4b]
MTYTLAYAGTLFVALLMFIGQLTAVAVLLVLAGMTRLVMHPIRAIARSFNRPRRP